MRAALDEVKKEQDIEQMEGIRKEIKQYSLEKQKLEKALEKTRLEYLKLL